MEYNSVSGYYDYNSVKSNQNYHNGSFHNRQNDFSQRGPPCPNDQYQANSHGNNDSPISSLARFRNVAKDGKDVDQNNSRNYYDTSYNQPLNEPSRPSGSNNPAPANDKFPDGSQSSAINYQNRHKSSSAFVHPDYQDASAKNPSFNHSKHRSYPHTYQTGHNSYSNYDPTYAPISSSYAPSSPSYEPTSPGYDGGDPGPGSWRPPQSGNLPSQSWNYQQQSWGQHNPYPPVPMSNHSRFNSKPTADDFNNQTNITQKESWVDNKRSNSAVYHNTSKGAHWQSSNNSKFGSSWTRKTNSTPGTSSFSKTANSEKASLSSSNSEALKPPDFENLELPPVKKDFYDENDHLNDRESSEIDEYLDEHQITLTGRYQPRPCITFEDIDLPEIIMASLKSKNFTRPTPIQAQTWPIALSGDDMVGLAQTGSGKTCAFIIPGLVHILNNKETPKGPNNPTMLVLCPTRELSQQVAQVTEDFAKPLGVNLVCVYGGAARHEQSQLLSCKTPEIIVATPGRLIDFMESKQVDVKLVSYLVLDEADRMLDMGFEPQIRTIIENIRPQRQTLMFSATWPDAVWQLAEDFLDSYTKVNVGSNKLSANHQITQVVECCEEEEKPAKLIDLLKQLIERDKTLRTLIFCDTKKAVNEVQTILNEHHFKASSIHGNKKQSDREFVLKQFTNDQVPILIATDVAARGLDISNIKHVINYDYPPNSEDYVHRIGRTARHHSTGFAYTFFTQANMGQSGKLISILEEAEQEVPTMLKFYASFVKQR